MRLQQSSQFDREAQRQISGTDFGYGTPNVAKYRQTDSEKGTLCNFPTGSPGEWRLEEIVREEQESRDSRV